MNFITNYTTNSHILYMSNHSLHYLSCWVWFQSQISEFISWGNGINLKLTIQTLHLNRNFKLDYFTILFISVALFVTWSVIEFSLWYIHLDLHTDKFFKYLLLFLITIIILVTAKKSAPTFHWLRQNRNYIFLTNQMMVRSNRCKHYNTPNSFI